jgi:pimeloyl-ACP methyl ester carboxylesterase
MPVLKTEHAELAYDDVGDGLPPMLLLHGFSCARTDYAQQVDAFSKRHRVIAFDQRGHGDSSLASDGRYGFEPTALDARRLCDELGVTSPVVVGHSLGGVSALVLASVPGFASALVLLDSTVELPPEVDTELAAYTDHLSALSDRAFADEIRAYARGRMIDPSDDPVIAERLVERAARVPKEVYVPGVRSIVGVDVAALAKAVAVPTLFIASSLPWLPPDRVHQLCPTWYVGRTVGAGHFHHLLVPDQVNAMIRRFLEAVDAGFPDTAPSEW